MKKKKQKQKWLVTLLGCPTVYRQYRVQSIFSSWPIRSFLKSFNKILTNNKLGQLTCYNG